MTSSHESPPPLMTTSHDLRTWPPHMATYMTSSHDSHITWPLNMTPPHMTFSSYDHFTWPPSHMTSFSHDISHDHLYLRRKGGQEAGVSFKEALDCTSTNTIRAASRKIIAHLSPCAAAILAMNALHFVWQENVQWRRKKKRWIYTRVFYIQGGKTEVLMQSWSVNMTDAIMML